MSRKLTLKELQKEGLKILKEVHAFCVNNNIMYSVAYGTLIGTIRHKGFIPWDDDIDIIMYREDYVFFCKNFKSKHYCIISPSDDNCLLAFARIYDDKITNCDAVAPWIAKDAGVYIDLFPIDYVSDNELEFKQQHLVMQQYWKKSTTARASLGRFRRDKSFIFNIKLLVKKILYFKKYKKIITKQVELLNEYKKDEATNHWSQLGCLDGYEYHNTSDFTSVSFKPFEDMEVMVLNGYHNILTNCFGDYMKLPPIDQRKGHCDGMTMFYWKNDMRDTPTV